MTDRPSQVERWRDGRPRPTSREKASTITVIRRTLALFRAVLREIFDESAYERFLKQHQISSSAAAYSRFCQEHDHSRARRPRCC